MRTFWIIPVDPKSSDKYLYKRRGEAQTQRQGCVKTQAEIGVMQPQAKGCLKPPEARHAEGAWPTNILIQASLFQNSERINFCCPR